MKIAPLHRELDKRGVDYVFVHTGQHYDEEMNEIFFEELGIREPDHNLGAKGSSISAIMDLFSAVLIEEDPDAVIVIGDINSTLACAITSSHHRYSP